MRVHLHVRILGFVPLEVDLQVPSRREAISAYVALRVSVPNKYKSGKGAHAEENHYEVLSDVTSVSK